MNSAWSKLLVVVACTLADSVPEGLGVYLWHPLDVFAHTLSNTTAPRHNVSTGGLSNMSSVCSAPCSSLGARLGPRHLVTPCFIALCAWSVASFPTLVLRSRHKVRGVRSCLWQLILLWVGLVVSSGFSMRDRVGGFVWMLHSSTQALTAWSPPKRVLVFQWARFPLCALGALAICRFAWSSGAPASLIRWHTGAQSLCGWSAHLCAVLGVDVVAWLLRPLEALVLGPQQGWEQDASAVLSEDVLHLE
jgi:hypothetical protein